MADETKSSKTILVISKYLPEYTGAAFRLNGLYNRLYAQKGNPSDNVEILCNSTSLTKSKTYHHDGLQIRRIVFPYRASWIPKKLRDAIKTYYEASLSFLYLMRKKPEFLHIAGYSGATMAALLYGRIYKIPRLIELVTNNATPFQYLPGLRYPNFLRLDKQTVIITISQKLADDCTKSGLTENIWCRPNPIDENRFMPDAEQKYTIRENTSPFDKDDIVIAMVAKFMPQKNQILLIDVMKCLPENHKLLLAGPRSTTGIYKERDTKYFNAIIKRIKQNNLEHRIHIHPEFIEADQYMKASDIYVMPQYNEGLGTPMLEAIACGVPVVANEEESAFRQWIKDNENGYLSAMKPEEWAKNIERAQAIPKDTLEKSVAAIHDFASTQKCDENYIRIISALKNISPEDEVKIQNVI